MQRGPKNINLQRGGLDPEGVYTSEAHNRKNTQTKPRHNINSHREGQDIRNLQEQGLDSRHTRDLHKQGPDAEGTPHKNTSLEQKGPCRKVEKHEIYRGRA